MTEFILAAATFCSALIAGFFFSYAVSVNWGLEKLEDKAYLQAMQHINRVILNPAFLGCFLGANILLIASTFQYYLIDSPRFFPLLAGTIFYTVGVFGITGVRNVPLNNQLEQFVIDDATDTSLRNMRSIFERPWIFWNTIRTWSALVALMCLIVAI